jgi:hypothetical protein
MNARQALIDQAGVRLKQLSRELKATRLALEAAEQELEDERTLHAAEVESLRKGSAAHAVMRAHADFAQWLAEQLQASRARVKEQEQMNCEAGHTVVKFLNMLAERDRLLRWALAKDVRWSPQWSEWRDEANRVLGEKK